MWCAEAAPPGAQTRSVSARRWRLVAAAALILISGRGIAGAAQTPRSMGATLHYAPNHNFDPSGAWRPAAAGFNIADIADHRRLRDLPAGVKGLIWVGQCAGADRRFIATVAPYLHEPNVFGFYLMDDPDPRIGLAQCKAESLREEADWLHDHIPAALTFIVLMNMSDAGRPSFQDTYNPANSHVDLYGIDPYPCRSELKGCSDTMIERYVAAAEAWGIPRSRVVPVYQAFGGGSWSDGDGGKYILPTAAQLQAMFARWRALIPAPMFDFAYSWGVQRGDHALENEPDLWAVFSAHNAER